MAQAQYHLGVCYAKSIGCKENPEEAFKYSKLAADQGHKEAQYNLGICYKVAIGCMKNPKKAFENFKLAAEQGLAQAQYELGLHFQSDFCTDYKDREKAVDQYKLAAEQGHKEAQFALGRCYAEGSGCSRNLKEALKTYVKLYQDIKDKESLNTLEAKTKKQIKSVFAILRKDKNLLNSLELETLEILRDVIHSRSASYFSAVWTTDAQIVEKLYQEKFSQTTKSAIKESLKALYQEYFMQDEDLPELSDQDYDAFIETALEFYKNDKTRSTDQWQSFNGVSELDDVFKVDLKDELLEKFKEDAKALFDQLNPTEQRAQNRTNIDVPEGHREVNESHSKWVSKIREGDEATKSAIKESLKALYQEYFMQDEDLPELSDQDYDAFIETALEFYKNDKTRSTDQWQSFNRVRELDDVFKVDLKDELLKQFQDSYKAVNSRTYSL